VVVGLRKKGLVSQWYSELYGVSPSFGQSPYFALERSVAPFFGVRTYGTHLNGYVQKEGRLFVWIAKRSDDLAFAPGRLDNLAAGGLPIGTSPEDNIRREAWEEARLPASMMERAISVGFVSYLLDTPEGISPDTMFTYDVELPDNFEPCTDGQEIQAFTLYPVEELTRIVTETEDFKYNSALVIIDFLHRRGIIDTRAPATPDIVRGLRPELFPLG